MIHSVQHPSPVFGTNLGNNVSSHIQPASFPGLKPKSLSLRTTKLASPQTPRNIPEVFLGGSCNPTTWRRDSAIPLLEAHGISYYNPQVDEWYPELLKEEATAKERAKVILFVIDNTTRSIVSMNEAAEYIHRDRRIVLVIQSIQQGIKIDNCALTIEEIDELNEAREVLRQHAIRRSINCFSSVWEAVNLITQWFINSPNRLTVPSASRRRLRKRSSIVLNEWSNQKGRCKLVKSVSASSLESHYDLLRNEASRDRAQTTIDTSMNTSEDEPCNSSISSSGTSPARNSFSRESSDKSIIPKRFLTRVFLGGDCHSRSTWRQRIAIPLLQKAGISYFNPQSTLSSHEQSAIFKPLYQKVKEQAELLIFVIDNKTRSLGSMLEAIELICSHRAVVIVIEPLESPTKLYNGENITGRSLKDLKRARAYFRETAERNDIACYSSIEKAMENIIRKSQGSKI